MPSPDLDATTSDPLTRRVVDLARALRQHGVAVGPSESVDAAAACAALGVTDRERLRAGVAAAMMRREGDRAVFDQLFDIYFPAAVGDRTEVGEVEAARDPASAREAAARLRDELADALAADDTAALDRLAARAVAELGALANEATTGSYSAAQALERLAPQTAIAAALQRARDAGRVVSGSGEGGGGGGSGSGGTQGGGSGGGSGAGEQVESLTDRFDRDEIRGRVAGFRRRVEREATRRNAEVRGAERISRYGVRDPLARKDFLLTGTTEAGELQAAIRPLARKIAARLAARQRRASRGSVDIRRTLRRAMSTGGVPVRPAYKHRHHSRADVVLVCDMSGSVSGFSRFTMLLLQALSTQFRRVRFFGFVNICDDITEIVTSARVGEDIRTEVAQRASMSRWHGSSDYGSALTDFVDRWLDAVGPRSTVLVLGDARTNGTEPHVEALRTIAAQARHVVWLNPEPRAQWDSGDSVAGRYGQVVDMHEVRNLDQLRQFVARALPV
ncbi:VWA domain-containing protein [Janibacter melonis]|uniref:VWA domain-containing protein n=1 Tax=Janibacter melonis TaxID=262209 RepID=UPI001E4509CC|nr:VWA domain-containing protein [Janibacter melonis]MCB5992737.1 VWA domain-containing protein [Janibacter melonis]